MPSRKRLLIARDLLPVGIRLALGILLSVVFSASAQTLQEAEQLFRKGAYERVIAVTSNRLLNPAPVEWRLLRARSLLTVGRYTEAYFQAQNAFNSAPGDLRTLLLLRETALFQNDAAGAERRLAEMKMLIERRGPMADDGESLVAFGQALLLLGVEPRIVLENCFRRAEKMNPPTREAFLAVGNLGLEKHDFALAADAFRAGLAKFPDEPDLQLGLAKAYEPGDREEMLKAVQAALKLNTNHVPSLLLLADHLIDGEQYDEAQKHLAVALKVNPSQPEALAYRSVLAHLKNEPEQEEQFRNAALQCWKTNPQVDHLIGRKLSQKYRFQEGAAAQRRSLAFQPDYLPAQRQLAEDLLRLGQTDEGWKLAEAVHRQDEYDVTAYNLTMLHDHMLKFRTITNANFTVRMSASEAELYGQRVLPLLDRAKDVLGRKYGVELTRPTVVEIFPQQKDFAVRTFGMPGNSGYLGVCFGSVITANSPASQAPNPANWEDVLWHEFCHVVTLNATKNKMPRWLSEGISTYEERQANPAWGERMNLAYRQMILDGELTPVSKLSAAFLTPKSSKHLLFAYYESSLLVEFLVQKFKLDSLKNILADLRDGKEINETIATRTSPMPELEKQFAAYVREMAGKLAPGVDLAKPPEKVSDFEAEAWRKLHPGNYHVQMERARELMNSNRWSDAKPVLESIANSYSGESRGDNPLWLLAVVERNLRNTNAELAVLERFAKQEADFADLQLRLIELYSERRNWTAVTNAVDQLLAVNPLISPPYRALATAATALNNNDLAIAAYRALLLLQPGDPVDLHFQLAKRLHARGGSQAEAKRHVLQALEEAPRFREAQKLLLEIENQSASANAAKGSS